MLLALSLSRHIVLVTSSSKHLPELSEVKCTFCCVVETPGLGVGSSRASNLKLS